MKLEFRIDTSKECKEKKFYFVDPTSIFTTQMIGITESMTYLQARKQESIFKKLGIEVERRF